MQETKYDYLIVGAGFFGAAFARTVTDAGKRCLVIDKRDHIGGNAYTKKIEGIDVHVYGPHIFHTNSEVLWSWINQFTDFEPFINCPKALANGKLYSLPFNMNTFYELWGVTTPQQAKEKIESQTLVLSQPAINLEEQALSMVGVDIYELLIKHYTAKQWQADPKDLPPEIIKRIPLRFIYDNNYFNDKYQGIPKNGYTEIFENLLKGIDVQLNVDFINNKNHYKNLAKKIVYTGKIDEYFDYCYGELPYRGLNFETKVINTDNYQGTAVINYSDSDVPYTRVVEHKHFNCSTKSTKTVVTWETPISWTRDQTPYYPIDNEINRGVWKKYYELSKNEPVIFGGRLAEYRYYDMHQVIASALKTAKEELQ